VAFDSTPNDLPATTENLAEPRPRRRPQLRILLTALAVATVVGSGLVVSGVADAAEHAIAHVFPGLMIDGCGGG
jgi:hypothetical protein